MLNIIINKEKAIVINTTTGGQWTMDTENFFGTVYSSLEKNYPNFDCDKMSEVIIAHIKKELSEQDDENEKYIFHCKEIGVSYYDLLMYINGHKVLIPTLKDIEKLRIEHRMTSGYLPTGISDDGGMKFEGLETVTQVIIAALYYYAFNGYKLVRCKHCGRWFATKTLETEYCNRISPCYNMIVSGEKVLNAKQPCGIAVKRIKKRLQDRRKAIYNKLYLGQPNCDGKCERCPYDDCIAGEVACAEFCNSYKRLKSAITECPSVDNFLAMHRFLYSDSMPKQERPNRRKSNEERRRLKGL